MTTPGDHPPSEAEVRAVVQQVVAGVLGVTPAPADTGPAAEPSPARSDAGSVHIAIGADHGGFPLKERIGFRLRESGYQVTDCGTSGPEAVDYPDFAHAVARLVGNGECDAGIIVDGAGIGSAMVANKVPGVRAALCYDLSSAANSREHNHANVLTLGAGFIGDNLAWQIVETWLATDWATGRHERRVRKIADIEAQYLRDGA